MIQDIYYFKVHIHKILFLKKKSKSLDKRIIVSTEIMFINFFLIHEF